MQGVSDVVIKSWRVKPSYFLTNFKRFFLRATICFSHFLQRSIYEKTDCSARCASWAF